MSLKNAILHKCVVEWIWILSKVQMSDTTCVFEDDKIIERKVGGNGYKEEYSIYNFCISYPNGQLLLFN